MNSYNDVLELMKRLEGFYYYYNWRAGKDNMIHKHDCGYCQYGGGTKRKNWRENKVFGLVHLPAGIWQ